MDEETLRGWVDAYGRAWQMADPDAAVLLCAEDASYRETPFAGPARGRQAIHAYWSLVREHHKNVEFTGAILSVDPAIVQSGHLREPEDGRPDEIRRRLPP